MNFIITSKLVVLLVNAINTKVEWNGSPLQSIVAGVGFRANVEVIPDQWEF